MSKIKILDIQDDVMTWMEMPNSGLILGLRQANERVTPSRIGWAQT